MGRGIELEGNFFFPKNFRVRRSTENLALSNQIKKQAERRATYEASRTSLNNIPEIRESQASLAGNSTRKQRNGMSQTT
jgi:ribosomal protein L9